jgi:hypothetical protein
MSTVSNYGYCLTIEPYCENCMGFEPKHEILDLSDMRTTRIEHHVFCENWEKCRQIKEHIVKTLKGYENGSKG